MEEALGQLPASDRGALGAQNAGTLNSKQGEKDPPFRFLCNCALCTYLLSVLNRSEINKILNSSIVSLIYSVATSVCPLFCISLSPYMWIINRYKKCPMFPSHNGFHNMQASLEIITIIFKPNTKAVCSWNCRYRYQYISAGFGKKFVQPLYSIFWSFLFVTYTPIINTGLAESRSGRQQISNLLLIQCGLTLEGPNFRLERYQFISRGSGGRSSKARGRRRFSNSNPNRCAGATRDSGKCQNNKIKHLMLKYCSSRDTVSLQHRRE